ncbi:MAG: hypothetical protein AAF823_10095 [Planctomycetota bacterium]
MPRRPRIRRRLATSRHRFRHSARALWRREQGPTGGGFVGAAAVAIGFGLLVSVAVTPTFAYAIVFPTVLAISQSLDTSDASSAVTLLAGMLGVLAVLGCFVTIAFLLPLYLVHQMRRHNFEAWARTHLGKGYRGRSDLCFACGYDLSHSKSLACPECGTRAASHFAELR